MAGETREGRLTTAFVTLADTLVAGYDVVDLLQTLVDSCSDLLEATAVGLVLTDMGDDLTVVASTSEGDELASLLLPITTDGPSVECFRTGQVVVIEDLLRSERWPELATDAVAAGVASVHVVPMRLRGAVIGAMSVFLGTPGRLDDEDASIAQALADVATIGILHERALRESGIAQAQLQRALDSRVVIEQAKGVVAQTRSIDMDEAFRTLRTYARSNGLNLRDVAELVVKRSISI